MTEKTLSVIFELSIDYCQNTYIILGCSCWTLRHCDSLAKVSKTRWKLVRSNNIVGSNRSESFRPKFCLHMSTNFCMFCKHKNWKIGRKIYLSATKKMLKIPQTRMVRIPVKVMHKTKEMREKSPTHLSHLWLPMKIQVQIFRIQHDQQVAQQYTISVSKTPNLGHDFFVDFSSENNISPQRIGQCSHLGYFWLDNVTTN
jgi:hypothetical protein